ncbi:HAMP domain-containing histidine kinase [Bacteroides salyersiae]|jgi:two-component system sensor histidine kinase|uniref:sensor histidine kinase n=1 Tax=Bacteroides salyersiae TaxID=291644 RepID=UPI001C38378A|nr:HAMP domain-containing sensor histidine kinase [Bacteroides salyersiae]MBV4205124.1 HAMP domain-containing histidine kinase [Bacteroides salyersiae]MCB6649851.1 HAMP domain-containing histidine kinase [Bacteroides salyersiae]
MSIKHIWFIAILGLITILALQYLWLHNTYILIKKDIEVKGYSLIKEAIDIEVINRINNFNKPIEPITDTITSSQKLSSQSILLQESLSRAGSDISLSNLDSIYNDLLKDAQISSNIIINKVDLKENKIIRSISKKTKPHWGTITIQTIPIRLDGSQGIQTILTNPFWIIFQRMWFILIATVLMMIFVIGCIIYQIRIIAKQNQIAQIRQDFSYAMIHDMKSPLNSIKIGVEILQSGKMDSIPEKKKKHFRIILEETEHLLKLVEKVLTISKQDSGKLELAKQEVYLQPMVDDIVEKFKAKTNKSMQVLTDLRTKIIYADEEYFKEAISNLIDNAIKYSKESINIEISSFYENEKVVVKVKDNGIGIPIKDQNIIFEKFERASATERTTKGGATGFGLGLSYVMRVIDAHGGTIQLDSVEGKYSEFKIELPQIL